MALRDIVTCKETSQKMAEVGLPQEEGVAYWFFPTDFVQVQEWGLVPEYATGQEGEYIRAWSFSELWDLLPKSVNFCGDKRLLYHLEYHKYSNYSSIGYFRLSIQEGELLEDSMKSKQNKLPHEAAAELLLWVKNEGYLNATK